MYYKQKINNSKKCVIKGKAFEKKFMLKLVLSPDGKIILDLNEKLPGKHIWISSERNSLVEAESKNLFSNFFGISKDENKKILYSITSFLKKRIIQRISLARKSSFAICGYEKIKSALLQDKIDLLIQACDGSKKEKSRLRGKFYNKFLIECLKSSEIGVAFGRNYTIHAGILSNGFNEKFKNDVQKLNNLIY
tara:strand:- start:536 stop:1114 length:579 start_codon:yes stop_codon:yes gene_type:complete